MQSAHVRLKIPDVKLDGFQLAKTSSEKSVSDVQNCHAYAQSKAEGILVLKEVNEVHSLQVFFKFQAAGNSATLKELSA